MAATCAESSKVSGFEFRVLGFGFRVLGFECVFGSAIFEFGRCRELGGVSVCRSVWRGLWGGVWELPPMPPPIPPIPPMPPMPAPEKSSRLSTATRSDEFEGFNLCLNLRYQSSLFNLFRTPNCITGVAGNRAARPEAPTYETCFLQTRCGTASSRPRSSKPGRYKTGNARFRRCLSCQSP